MNPLVSKIKLNFITVTATTVDFIIYHLEKNLIYFKMDGKHAGKKTAGTGGAVGLNAPWTTLSYQVAPTMTLHFFMWETNLVHKDHLSDKVTTLLKIFPHTSDCKIIGLFN